MYCIVLLQKIVAQFGMSWSAKCQCGKGNAHPRVAEVIHHDVVAVIVVAAAAGVVEGAGHELVAGVPRRRHVKARAVVVALRPQSRGRDRHRRRPRHPPAAARTTGRRSQNHVVLTVVVVVVLAVSELVVGSGTIKGIISHQQIEAEDKGLGSDCEINQYN